MTDRTAAAGPRRRSATTLFAWALRILLLALAGAALSLALSERPAANQRPATYLCPMHRQIRAPIPGRCPICGMALVPAENTAASSGEAGPALAPGDLHTVRAYLFTTPTHAPAWIDADGAVVALLYRDEVEGLDAGTSATFSLGRAPDAAVAVTPEHAAPRAWDAETLAVRFRFAGPSPALPGAPGWVDLPRARRPVRAVEEALVFTDDSGGRYVLVPTPDGRSVERRAVEIGRVINGRAVIVSGLQEGEQIVRRRAFFLDADLRARAVSAAGSGP